jgi:CPA1 family monovalent cation:H+ antiporter
MSTYAALSSVLVVAALLSYLNRRLLRLPTTVGVTLLVLVVSFALLGAKALGLPVDRPAVELVARLRFDVLVFDGLLAFLLFAGALSVAHDVEALFEQRWAITLLATAGVAISTFFVGLLGYGLCRLFGAGLTLPECLLFGALVSPTDPVAVIAMLRSSSAPKAIEVQLAGEALFNDGVGVVAFAAVLGFIEAGPASAHVAPLALALGRQVIGGIAVGALGGWLVVLMLRSLDDAHVEIVLTIAAAAGIYGLARALGTSGPLAVIVAGIVVGGVGRARAMSPRTTERLDEFWELVDETLNTVLFVLLGLQILVMPITGRLLGISLAMVAVVLAARLATVWGAALALRWPRPRRRTAAVLTWGGLRGGLSLAMALSIGPGVEGRHTIQAMAYVVAVFSIAVQGLTFRRLVTE